MAAGVARGDAVLANVAVAGVALSGVALAAALRAPVAPVNGAHPDAAPAAAQAPCQLVLEEPRQARELMRPMLDARQPEIRIAFVHSVLGTDVVDRYRFTPRPVLVEEEFAGQGYGLPDGPGPGERWQPLPDGRVRLSLHRPVDPLVVLALPSQRMRILHPDGDLLLGRLGVTRVRLRAEGCPSALSAASALPASSTPSSGSTATTSSALSAPPAPSSPPAHASKLPR